VQVGFSRAKNLVVGDCGAFSGNLLRNFWESIGLPPNASAVPQCAYLGQTTANASSLYTVFRRNSSATGNSFTWRVNINTTQSAPDRNVGFDAGKIGIAGGEIKADPNSLSAPAADGDVFGCFGCSATPSGVILWQKTTSAGSAGWADIQSASNFSTATTPHTDSRWHVDSLPGPFVVHHTCDPNHAYGC